MKQTTRLKIIYLLNAANIATLTLAQIAIVPLFLHYLGVRGYEQWVFIVAVGAACLLCDLGMVAYNSNSARIAYGNTAPEAAQDVIGYGAGFFVGFFCLFAVVSAVICATSTSPLTLALALTVLNAPFALFRTWLSYIFTARISQIGELVFFIAFTLGQTACYAATVIMGGSVQALAATQMATTVIFGIAPLLCALRRYAPDIRLAPRLLPPDKIRVFIAGCLANFGYSAASIATVHFPVILLGVIPGLPSGTLAIFTTSRTLTGIVRQFCQQLGRSNAIEISRLVAPGDKARRQRLFVTGAAMTAALAALGMGGLLPIASTVITMWTRNPHLYDPAVIALFCVATTISAQLQLPAQLPQFTNKAATMAAPLLAQILLLVTLGIPAVCLIGAAGMVAAVATAEWATMGVACVRRVIPETGVKVSRFIAVTGIPACALFALSAASSWEGKRLFPADTFYGLIKIGLLWSLLMVPAVVLLYRAARGYRW